MHGGQVPKSAVEPGHSAPIEVTVRTESWLRDTRQVFDVNINCRGAYSKIELRFVADFVELCQFPHHDYSFSMSDDSEVEDFSLPLMVSSDIDAAKLTLSPRDDFEGWTAQIERKEKQIVAKVSKPKGFEQTKTFLESSYCSMTAKSRVAPLCEIRPLKAVEILPNRLIFAVSEKERLASPILVVRSKSGSLPVGVRDIKVSLPNSEAKISLEYQMLSTNSYRLKIRFQDAEKIPSQGTLD